MLQEVITWLVSKCEYLEDRLTVECVNENKHRTIYMLDNLAFWVWDNKEWVFSGIGCTLLAWILFRSKNSLHIKMKQAGGNNSTNIQTSGNINLSGKNHDQ